MACPGPRTPTSLPRHSAEAPSNSSRSFRTFSTSAWSPGRSRSCQAQRPLMVWEFGESNWPVVSNEKASGAGVRASEFDANTGKYCWKLVRKNLRIDHTLEAKTLRRDRFELICSEGSQELQTPAFARTGASPPMPEYHGTIGTGP